MPGCIKEDAIGNFVDRPNQSTNTDVTGRKEAMPSLDRTPCRKCSGQRARVTQKNCPALLELALVLCVRRQRSRKAGYRHC